MKYDSNAFNRMFSNLNNMFTSDNNVLSKLKHEFEKAYYENKNVNLENVGKKENASYSITSDIGLDNIKNNANFKDAYDDLKNREIKAEQLLNSGVPVDEVFRKTGWLFDNVDGKWKGEFFDDNSINKIYNWATKQKGIQTDIDSQNSVLQNKQLIISSNFPTFKDILGNDSLLLAMYPKLKNVKFVLVEGIGSKRSAGATYNNIVNGKLTNVYAIAIAQNESPGKPFDYDVYIENIAHELQHAIQSYEGFEYGDKNATEYKELHGEIEAYNQGYKQTIPELRWYNDNGYLNEREIKNEEIIGESTQNDQQLGNIGQTDAKYQEKNNEPKETQFSITDKDISSYNESQRQEIDELKLFKNIKKHK